MHIHVTNQNQNHNHMNHEEMSLATTYVLKIYSCCFINNIVRRTADINLQIL